MEDVFKYDETGKIVTGVKDKNLISVVIPDGVTGIGKGAIPTYVNDVFWCEDMRF